MIKAWSSHYKELRQVGKLGSPACYKWRGASSLAHTAVAGRPACADDNAVTFRASLRLCID